MSVGNAGDMNVSESVSDFSRQFFSADNALSDVGIRSFDNIVIVYVGVSFSLL